MAGGAESHAARCRLLLSRASRATLSTLARDPAGFPYGSLVAVAADADGRPLLLLSKLAEHTQNLAARAEASVLVADETAPGDPLAGARVTILGTCRPVPDEEARVARETFLQHHPEAARYADFKDFTFYRLEPAALRYVEGFGRMSWVTAEDYKAAPLNASP
jgi:putative heme iron utilization protein